MCINVCHVRIYVDYSRWLILTSYANPIISLPPPPYDMYMTSHFQGVDITVVTLYINIEKLC